MTKLSRRFRIALAAALFVLWAAWAFWSNNPHRYDAQAFLAKQAEQFPLRPAPKLLPAVGGFPVVHMRYDFSRNDQLTIHEYSKDKLGVNVLSCTLATLAVTILALRTPTVSRRSLTVVAVLISPICIAYVLLGGWDRLAIAYAYFLPVGLLLGSLWPFPAEAEETAMSQNLGRAPAS